jgi:1-aminocyclopropane-1-carboxylate deaminase/D-cysteine desulfhydrase-like pyridoxal-dependent ACC family enzyme
VKNDELTGLGLGGNKVRKLEHELAPEHIEGVTHVVTTGGAQSNHCRVTAAAAARLGLGCVLVVNGDPGDPPRGNALLHRLLGAEVRTVPDRAARETAMNQASEAISAAGGRAPVIPLGASTPRGALGYSRAAVELADQLEARGESIDSTGGLTVFLASSSAGTLGGLAAGFTLLDRRDVRLVGVSADVPREELVGHALALAQGALELVGAPAAVPPGMIDASDGEVGEGYGVPTEASREATRLFARTEGLVLDPFYTSKAAAGMIRAIRQGELETRGTVVFLHTGGHPALLV